MSVGIIVFSICKFSFKNPLIKDCFCFPSEGMALKIAVAVASNMILAWFESGSLFYFLEMFGSCKTHLKAYEFHTQPQMQGERYKSMQYLESPSRVLCSSRHFFLQREKNMYKDGSKEALCVLQKIIDSMILF